MLLAHAWATYEIRPLLEWDGWAIWGTRSRALYEFGGATGPVFTSDVYLPLQHPLLLPSLDAIDFRAMGTYDPTLVHVQLALLAFGFLLGFVSLLRDRVPLALVGATALAVLSAEPVLKQLSTGLADVPLAFFVALGLLGTGRWLASGERWALVAGTLFLGAATLTKSEGLFFALAALLALAPFAWSRRRELGVAAAAVVAIVLPWRLFVSLRDLPLVEYRFRDAVSPAYLSDHCGPRRPGGSRARRRAALGRLGAARAALPRRGRRRGARRPLRARGLRRRLDRARVLRARPRLLDLDDPGRPGARLVGRPHDRHRGRRRGRARTAPRGRCLD